ncbi:MAG: Ferrous-iron efflux pump FieF [Pelotomaculum sp. PtaB.Bin104]|nr:MAG: Ferrous-iron efflux pump FieF [Pelotomaculum sp. PtaB.Bin104]
MTRSCQICFWIGAWTPVVATGNLCYTTLKISQAENLLGRQATVMPVGLHQCNTEMQPAGYFIYLEFCGMNQKVKVATLSIASNTILTLAKLAIGISMNSVSVISEAVHSGLDLIASLIAFFSVRKSSMPADRRHQYGHGKFENVAGIAEALLILGAAVYIVLNAWPKLFGQAEIKSLDLGAAVMGASAVINFIVSRKLFVTGLRTDSPALVADAWHLLTDVYTSLSVLVGIIAIKLTGLTIIDPLIAILVSLLILRAAVKLIRESMLSILDVSLPESEERVIKEVLAKYSLEFVEFHKLRTRKAGSQRYVDLHLVVPAGLEINRAHQLCELIEEDMRRRLLDVHVLIHTEPCRENCTECRQGGLGQVKNSLYERFCISRREI